MAGNPIRSGIIILGATGCLAALAACNGNQAGIDFLEEATVAQDLDRVLPKVRAHNEAVQKQRAKEEDLFREARRRQRRAGIDYRERTANRAVLDKVEKERARRERMEAMIEFNRTGGDGGGGGGGGGGGH